MQPGSSRIAPVSTSPFHSLSWMSSTCQSPRPTRLNETTDEHRSDPCSSVFICGCIFSAPAGSIFAFDPQIFNGFVTAGKFEPPRSRGPEHKGLQRYPSIGQFPPFVPLSPHRPRPQGASPSKPSLFRFLHGEYKGVRHANGLQTTDNGLPASNA